MSPSLNLMMTSFIQGFWKAAFHWKQIQLQYRNRHFRVFVAIKVVVYRKELLCYRYLKRNNGHMDFTWHANN